MMRLFLYRWEHTKTVRHLDRWIFSGLDIYEYTMIDMKNLREREREKERGIDVQRLNNINRHTETDIYIYIYIYIYI